MASKKNVRHTKDNENDKTAKIDNIEVVSDSESDSEDNKNNKNKKTNEKVIKTSNLHSPYTDTTLICPVMLYPNQLDNKKYLHLKTNLTNKLVGKCYKNYGFITDVYKIEEESDGIIEAEDPTCSAKYIVKFSCRLCYPIKNKELILKIDRMNKTIISGKNGPITAIITPDKINKEKFFTDNNRNIRNKITSNMLVPETYIKALVLQFTFSDSDSSILVIGFLQDMATDEEIELFNKEQPRNLNLQNLN